MSQSDLGARQYCLTPAQLVRWQRLQDHLANVLGLPLRTVSERHKLLSDPSWPAAFPAEQAIVWMRIGEELDELIPAAQPPIERTQVTTSLGVSFAAQPICFRSGTIGVYCIAGPFILKPLDPTKTIEDEIRLRFAQSVDPQALRALVLSLRSFSFAGVRSVLDLIIEVAETLTRKTDEEKTKGIPPAHLLQSLLDAAIGITRARGGSVMIADAEGCLTIHAAVGLPESVVEKTRLAPGEGLAGLAMAQRRLLLVDNAAADPQLHERMHLKHLISSMVTPLIPQDQNTPVGVLNLRTDDPAFRFTSRHVELLRQFLALASLTLAHS